MNADGHWMPLESNSEWTKQAGLDTSSHHFEDVYGFDPELLALLTEPVIAALLVFPISEQLENKRREEDEKLHADADEQTQIALSSLFWIKQTIPASCGTIGMLHILANTPVSIKANSPLKQFYEACKDKSPEEKALMLESTHVFANIHLEASPGQSDVTDDPSTRLHFTCFAKARCFGQYRLIEFDGRRKGPIDRGECQSFITDVTKVIKEKYLVGTKSDKYSMIVLCGS
ncbi:hypothetical protein AMATHDRAFT_77937 [Amanita thiersii Skay4041]|uniref:ubiquitinyl hydrolase 1 n=1 Tax=Amanita thiersii Skay4041 TaxID=703135 RepID=A0A2A9N739_9AGAR|nr:hypothetical protein AMATHDRAFT_77937 [Amanita thiersii Skay4041]